MQRLIASLIFTAAILRTDPVLVTQSPTAIRSPSRRLAASACSESKRRHSGRATGESLVYRRWIRLEYDEATGERPSKHRAYVCTRHRRVRQCDARSRRARAGCRARRICRGARNSSARKPRRSGSNAEYGQGILAPDRDDSRRVRIAAENPRVQQALLPIQPLADLDFRVLHRARTADLRSLRARLRSADGLWLGAVLVGTGIAGLRGALPGVEPKPYIIRFTEDRPNPLYRRVCYTFAWSEVVTFAVLNITGLVVAIATGQWYLKQIYRYAYFPLAGDHLAARRARAAAAGEGVDQRRGARAALLLRIGLGGLLGAAGAVADLERSCRGRRAGDPFKLVVFVGDSRVRRQPRPPRPFAPNPANRPRRTRRFRLIRGLSLRDRPGDSPRACPRPWPRAVPGSSLVTGASGRSS